GAFQTGARRRQALGPLGGARPGECRLEVAVALLDHLDQAKQGLRRDVAAGELQRVERLQDGRNQPRDGLDGRLVHRQSFNIAASSGARPRSRSAAFSAIISTEALRLADGMVGMIEASITRRFSNPRTRSWSSTTAVGSVSGAMRQEPMRWKVVVPRFLAASIRSASDCACAPGNSSRS